MRSRREVEGSNLAFLDVVCCGFGAIILLLVLTKSAEPVLLTETLTELRGRITGMEKELESISQENRSARDELESEEERVVQLRRKIQKLEAELSDVRGQYDTSVGEAEVKTTVQERLAAAQQELSEEMKRLLGESHRRVPGDGTVGGIPVDSEYVIFVIDTSGSMQSYSWDKVRRKVDEALDIYPQLKGIQVMSDMGEYMFSRYAGRWIPDSPSRRKAILKRLTTWNPFSNSSPAEGLTRAIRTFYSPDRKISVYVLGDEFTGASIDNVVRQVDSLNRADASGERRVRIHALGFPLPRDFAGRIPLTGQRYATLMRILTERNGGSFVGLARN